MNNDRHRIARRSLLAGLGTAGAAAVLRLKFIDVLPPGTITMPGIYG